MKIIRTGPAIDDLEAIHEYISRDSAVYADAMIRQILTAIDQLEKFPKIGRMVPELEDPETRELIVRNYRVIYDCQADGATWCSPIPLA